MVRVRLSGILTPADWSSVRHLRRGPGQHRYLNSMEEIQNEAREDERAKPRPWAIHDADTGALVGFTMISDNIPEPIDDDLVGPYFLWKLLIDHSVQGRGYGAATLEAVVRYLENSTRCRRAVHQLLRWSRFAPWLLFGLRLH